MSTNKSLIIAANIDFVRGGLGGGEGGRMMNYEEDEKEETWGIKMGGGRGYEKAKECDITWARSTKGQMTKTKTRKQ